MDEQAKKLATATLDVCIAIQGLPHPDKIAVLEATIEALGGPTPGVVIGEQTKCD